MKQQIKSFLLSLAFGICLFLLAPPTAGAQTSLLLTVDPAQQELLVDPGEKTAVTIKFSNPNETPVSGIIRTTDFGPDAVSWVNLPYDRITIAPKNKVMFQAKINVPLSARPGGQYLAVYFEPSGNPEESTVAPRLASLVYLRVSGPITEDAFVSRFSINRFSEYGPVNIATEILNRGDYHIRPIGFIKITDMLGNEIDRAKLTEQNIFPNTSGFFENKLGQKWMFGKYKAELTAAYGETGKILNAIAYFWIIPWKIITIVFLILITIILLRFTISLVK